MRYTLSCIVILLLYFHTGYSQGRAWNYFLGYARGLDSNTTSFRSRMNFDGGNLTVIPDSFSMRFFGTQATISTEAGELLMFTNGCEIFDSTKQLMLNGDSLIPGPYYNTYCTISPYGQPFPGTHCFIPMPGDSNQYYLFHSAGVPPQYFMSDGIYYSTIDMRLNNGKGGVVQKNIHLFAAQTFNTFAITKHANGRDWWFVMLGDNDTIYTTLVTPSGVSQVIAQKAGLPSITDSIYYSNILLFSPDGSKIGFHTFKDGVGSVMWLHFYAQLNFDRCTGIFSNPQIVSFGSQKGGYGVTYSANSKYAYFGTFDEFMQVNTDTVPLQASLDTIAMNQHLCYPPPWNGLCNDFWYGYLAPNGKIYISTGSSLWHLNYINFPDSDGIACDFRQRAQLVPCYTYGSHVYHPNYYLGPVLGSVCDSLVHVGLQEHLDEVQNFRIYPNPVKDSYLRIEYLLPQNAAGIFELYDLNGKLLYTQLLPTWSTYQNINLPNLSDGVYQCSIKSGTSRVSKKLVVMR